MSKKLDIYLCEVCGNIMETLRGGAVPIVCCGDPMTLLKEQTADSSTEKHVPVVEKVDGGVKVKVGSVPHPMVDKHYIEWIEIIVDGRLQRQFLNPGDEPEAVFCTDAEEIIAREHCSIHGLWKG